MARRTQFMFGQDARQLSGPASAMRRLGAIAALTGSVLVVVQACERSPFEPYETAPVVRSSARRADLDPTVDIATLLDSLAIGGVYSVTPRGGYSSLRYTLMPERAVYANPIRGHPTGIELPVGLPVRVLAEGAVVSHSTPTFLTSYCARYGGGDSHCATPSYTYTVHGLAPDGVLTNPYALGTGLQVQWSRLGARYAAPYPSPEFFSGAIPAGGAATTAELHFRREAGCCYYPPFGDAVYTAWETYEGQWRFAVVMDDGGRPENGVLALLTMSGPRTNQPMADSATFTLTAAGGGTLSETRWWFIQPASNTFDGEPLPFVQEPSSGLMVPRYPDAQRSVITEIPACAAQSTCRYQAAHSGALVAMARMPNGSFLGAGNRGLNSPHLRITVDSTTLAQGDTTVFRTTAPGAKDVSVTGYYFVPSASLPALAMRSNGALRAPGAASGGPAVSAPIPQRPAVRQGTSTSVTEGVTAVRVGRKAHFLDATFDCSLTTEKVCYDDPPRTGYEVVTAKVDGVLQRDSVLVTVVPVLKLTCSDRRGVSDAKGGATVVRADTVSCRASATEGLLAVTDWSFASTGYPYSLTRTGGDDSTYARDSSTWTGPMFTAGLVTVGAKVGGVDQTASAQVLVTARSWNTRWLDSTRWTAREVAHRHGDPPAADSELGLNRVSPRRDAPSSYLMVGQGPNQGLLAFTRFPFILEFEVSVNYAAMQTGSNFYGMQPRSATGNYCSATTMVNSLPLVMKHEGFVPVDTIGSKLSHTFNYKRWFRKTLNDSVEAFVDKDLDSFGERIERLRDWGDSVAADSSNAITHRLGSNPFTLSCRFNYDPAVRF